MSASEPLASPAGCRQWGVGVCGLGWRSRARARRASRSMIRSQNLMMVQCIYWVVTSLVGRASRVLFEARSYATQPKSRCKYYRVINRLNSIACELGIVTLPQAVFIYPKGLGRSNQNIKFIRLVCIDKGPNGTIGFRQLALDIWNQKL